MFIFRGLLRILLVLIIVGAIAIGVLGREQILEMALGPVTYSPIDFRTLQLGPNPNQYLVCPPDLCTAATDVASNPVYDVSQDALKKAWLAVMAEQPRTVQIGISSDASQFDFIQRSEWVRFPDTITVKFIALPTGQSTLAIYSRSHYGTSDFGVNRERIEGWLQRLDQHLKAQAQS